jgi:hypothetical protein
MLASSQDLCWCVQLCKRGIAGGKQPENDMSKGGREEPSHGVDADERGIPFFFFTFA